MTGKIFYPYTVTPELWLTSRVPGLPMRLVVKPLDDSLKSNTMQGTSTQSE